MKSCSVEGCNNKHDAKGYCSKHYRQVRKHGSVLENTIADFNILVDKNTYFEIVLTDRDLKEIGRAKFDKEDLAKIQNIGRWTLHSAGYVVNTHTDIYMHRLVMNASDEDYVDHIKNTFKSKSDNRKKKLRLCSNAENNWNKGKQANNTSGYKGVFFDNTHKVWKARIQIEGKVIGLGTFKTAERASKAYKAASKEYHGEFRHKDQTNAAV